MASPSRGLWTCRYSGAPRSRHGATSHDALKTSADVWSQHPECRYGVTPAWKGLRVSVLTGRREAGGVKSRSGKSAGSPATRLPVSKHLCHHCPQSIHRGVSRAAVTLPPRHYNLQSTEHRASHGSCSGTAHWAAEGVTLLVLQKPHATSIRVDSFLHRCASRYLVSCGLL